MHVGSEANLFGKIKNLLIGKARNPNDPELFHKITLIVFFAWVGLGADGLSSSCYGPEEAFLALKTHMFLGIFVALATAFTIFIISTSYSQIIELFPSGGGGYLVASKLLSPAVGMVSGCALLIDYVLTITISIASGADALFSLFPAMFYSFKLEFAIAGVLLLTLLNMRGAKESVLPLIPIFLIFLLTHTFAIIYALSTHASGFGAVAHATVVDVKSASAQIGTLGMVLLILRAYSMGAGTYTGIEAVSNGLPILREPRVQTAKRTMQYMAASLAFMAVGLMLGYLLYGVSHVPGKTLNAVLLERITMGWNPSAGYTFVLVALIAEATLLFVAAQTGFLDGPRVLANMALDRWFPAQFAILSERFVTQNGILLMGGASLLLMIFSRGSVKFLVILYSINVFITFCLSQLGMVRHWWLVRKEVRDWVKKIAINGVGLVLCFFILASVLIIKFGEGGWITLFITGSLIGVALLVKSHYKNTVVLLKRLDSLISVADFSRLEAVQQATNGHGKLEICPTAKTAVVLVSGYNGLGLHTLFNILRLFKDNFKNFFFIQAGIMDAGNFKGAVEIEKLNAHVKGEVDHYVTFMQSQGFCAQGFSAIGIDVVDEVAALASDIYKKYPQAIFFGGEVVFPKDTFSTRLLYNHTTFAIQKKLYREGIPFLIMPIRVE